MPEATANDPQGQGIMKAIIGTALGVFATGLVLLGAGLRLSSGPAALATSSPALATPEPRSGDGGRTATGPVMVNCSPGQRAVVRPLSVNGETLAQVACVDEGTGPATVRARGRAVPIAQHASYRAPRRTAVAERRVVYQEPAPARVAPAKSSWKEPLLVIGGSTAAGAGIGGLLGGKKGALIGAALGGGASTLVEATRR